jgi:hypothetical protein
MDNQFISYLDQIITFVILVKSKYRYEFVTFDSKFVKFIEDNLDGIKRDYKILFRTYILSRVVVLFSDEFCSSVRQFSLDEIKNYAGNKDYLNELNVLMIDLEKQFKLGKDIFQDHKELIKLN